MTFSELKKIAHNHIRKDDNLPSNSFLLLMQLHIPYKTEIQCAGDFEGSISPLYNTPAFLYIDSSGNKTVYFNSKTKYWNFYIFHEIAHYLLGHEDDCPQNEMDADMLACILAAPEENFPSTIKTARDLSTVCQLPIDKAEMYWKEIKPKRKFLTPVILSSLSLLALCSVILTLSFHSTNDNKVNTPQNPPALSSAQEGIVDDEHLTVYVTLSGTKYHLPTCQYVKDKSNLIEYDVVEAINNGYQPCKICIESN